jgi:aryl-alcohol dehydrogenase-like predicted oxidoreductase
VVATKVFGETGTGPNARGLTRSHILDGVEASLKRLQLDHIDLYQVHGFDPATPIDETLRALDQLVRHGHVRYVGVSNWAAWQIAKALGTSVAQVALAWLLHQPQVTSVIVGAKRPEQLADNIGATGLTLSADELARIDEASRLPPEYPGWMFERQGEHRRRQLDEVVR